MADDDCSPRPFRRERNLSNRNFNKRGSAKRRFSTESHSSIDSLSLTTTTGGYARPTSTIATVAPTTTTTTNNDFVSGNCNSTSTSTSTSSLDISYSVNSASSESEFNRNSVLKMLEAEREDSEQVQRRRQHGSSSSLDDSKLEIRASLDDPALLDVKTKVERFETFQNEERIIRSADRPTSRTLKILNAGGPKIKESSTHRLGPLRVLPVFGKWRHSNGGTTSPSLGIKSFHTSIDEERSEDEVDRLTDYEEEPESEETRDDSSRSETANSFVLSESEGTSSETKPQTPQAKFTMDDFGEVDNPQRPLSSNSSQSVPAMPSMNSPAIAVNMQVLQHSASTSSQDETPKANKDFKRNYRSTPRPKTEIIGSVKNIHDAGKHRSLYESKDDSHSANKENAVDDGIDGDEPELRNKSIKIVQPILDELIRTEETYVDNLMSGIASYGNIFERKDLPPGLRGKKYVLFGNIEQIAEFHRYEFLPMLHRTRHDLKRLFNEFLQYIEHNYFYGYVIFTMNKQRSLKLCDVYKNYFKLIQTELDDKLGINSFLVQPIQRMARYPLLLQQFMTTLFKQQDFSLRPVIDACCRLEKRVRTLLTTTNESEIINDITDCNEFNVFYQGKFRKVSEFLVTDHTLKRNYHSKVFIFDKCIIYTEISRKSLVFRGRYPCEHIGIKSNEKSFTLFYERRKQQECDFQGSTALIELWVDLITDMVKSYAIEEREKLKEIYSRENDHLHRKPPSLSLFRDSNRFSSDSGIGNIWVMPKPELAEDAMANRTTWYAIS